MGQRGMRGRVGTPVAIALRSTPCFSLSPSQSPSIRLLSLLYFTRSSSLSLSPSVQLFHPVSICANFAVLASRSRPVSSSLSLSPPFPSLLFGYSIFLLFTFPRMPFFPLSVSAISFCHFVSLFLFFSTPRRPLPLRSRLSVARLGFPRPVPLQFSFPHLSRLSFFPFASIPLPFTHPRLSRIFIFIFPFSRRPPRPPLSPLLSLSLSRALPFSVESAHGTRETIMGRTGWLCPPQDIGVSG